MLAAQQDRYTLGNGAEIADQNLAGTGITGDVRFAIGVLSKPAGRIFNDLRRIPESGNPVQALYFI